MLDTILAIIAIEIACIVALLAAIRGVRSRNGMRDPQGGEGAVEPSRRIEETVSPVGMLSHDDAIGGRYKASKAYPYDDRPLSQGLSKTYSPLHGGSEPGRADDWLEQEARFFYGPLWDEMSDSDKENAIGFMNVYGLDLALFGDADGDGLPDHPD